MQIVGYAEFDGKAPISQCLVQNVEILVWSKGSCNCIFFVRGPDPPWLSADGGPSTSGVSRCQVVRIYSTLRSRPPINCQKWNSPWPVLWPARSLLCSYLYEEDDFKRAA